MLQGVECVEYDGGGFEAVLELVFEEVEEDVVRVCDSDKRGKVPKADVVHAWYPVHWCVQCAIHFVVIICTNQAGGKNQAK